MYVFGLPILGFVLGIVLVIQHREESNQNFRSAKEQLSPLLDKSGGDLRDHSDEIIRIFSEYKYEVIEQSEDEIVFKHPPLFNMTIEKVIWLFLFTFGGVIGYLIALHFWGKFDDRVTMRLVPTS